MHAVKGGLVRQIYALAKCNESAGKKSRIRLSKEKRKTMVESFIKKYQKSNNGKFPSISVTHKEVGGSFYIIREIVREIIQENRVLGPAKLTQEEHSIDRFLEKNPLGSISTMPLTHLLIHSNESHASDASGSYEVTIESEYKNVDSEQIINGNLLHVSNETDGAAIVEFQVIEPLESDISEKASTVTTSKVTDEAANVELHLIEPLESDITDKELIGTMSNVTPITTDIEVETFPFRPGPEPTDRNDGRSKEIRELSENLYQLEHVKDGADDKVVERSDMNSSIFSMLKDEKEVEDIVVPIADMKVVENVSDSLLESSDCSTRKSVLHKSQNGAAPEVVSDNDVLTSKTNEQSQVIAGEAVNASNGIHPKVHSTLSGSSGESTIPKEVKSKDDVLHVNSQKGGNKTLDRINLESWEGTSNSNARSKTNPIWGTFRSFISAFAKFWSV